MAVIFAALSVLMLTALVAQRKQYTNLTKDIRYISDRLNAIQITSENGFVLLPTDQNTIKELIAVVNRLLRDFYKHRADFEQSKRAMEQVLTNISHDIRTPLTVLKGNSEMLACKAERSTVLPEHIKAMAEKIDQKADELITTINAYFTMSKITSGDFPLNLKIENISQICHETILEYFDLLEENQFEVDISIPESPVFAKTDPDALKRILKNLIDNAVCHGGDGKYIALRITSTKDQSIIEIEDHGKGISVQQQKQIFSRNYTTAPKASGNGLGLAIAKSLAEKMGAGLQVQSIQYEKTIFFVILKS